MEPLQPPPGSLQEKLIAWVDSKWLGEKDCPICARNQWTVPEELVELRPYHGGNLVVGGGVYPAAQLVCGNCGHTLFFNALVAGLIEQFPEPDPERDAEGEGSEKS